MSLEFKWGLPKREVAAKQVEKNPDTAVLNMQQKPGEKKRTYRFSFNSKAVHEMGLTLTGKETITFGFPKDKDGKITCIMIGIDKGDHPNTCAISKKGEFSSRPIHDFIAKSLALSQDVDNEFLVVQDEAQEAGVYTLAIIKEEVKQETPHIAPTIDSSVGTLVED
jgi:hypothetical protein